MTIQLPKLTQREFMILTQVGRMNAGEDYLQTEGNVFGCSLTGTCGS